MYFLWMEKIIKYKIYINLMLINSIVSLDEDRNEEILDNY